ncbi:hypothetical protein BDE02_03G184200 [Populus trichocarpa]|nr:hypothetical protein BDE02_03G184200 [Populus trichocarpa]
MEFLVKWSPEHNKCGEREGFCEFCFLYISQGDKRKTKKGISYFL